MFFGVLALSNDHWYQGSQLFADLSNIKTYFSPKGLSLICILYVDAIFSCVLPFVQLQLKIYSRQYLLVAENTMQKEVSLSANRHLRKIKSIIVQSPELQEYI